MNLRYGVAAALVAAIAISTTAVPSRASTEQSTYTTSLTQQLPFPTGGAYTGSLRLTIGSNGTVSGYYVPDDQTQFIPVTGGTSGTAMWLSIGSRGDLIINATMQSDGSLIGSATELSNQTDTALNDAFDQPVTYQFDAKQTSK